jgi:hypothetical protein
VFIHYHSLYVGIIAYAILLFLGAPIASGMFGIAVCLGADYQKFKSRLKKHDGSIAYAVASLIQALVLFLAYVILYFVIYRSTP